MRAGAHMGVGGSVEVDGVYGRSSGKEDDVSNAG
jgi:hypothetical protein